MEKLNDYKENKGKPLFSNYDIFDWYDGAISGIGNLSGTGDFYLFNIVAWDIISQMKVFSIINVTSLWLDKFKDIANEANSNLIRKVIESYFRQYSGDIFLLHSKDIDSVEYDLIKPNTISLQFYSEIEKIANQSDEEKQKWFNLFM